MSKKIQKNYSYFASFVTFPQDKYTSFQVGVKNEDGTYTNYKVFCFEKHEWLVHGTKFKLKDIISVELGDWQGKPQFNITAEIAKEETAADMANAYLEQTVNDGKKAEEEFSGPTLDISADMLPF